MSELDSFKIDLSDHLISKKTLNGLDVRAELLRDAAEKVADINKKTAEQVIIVKQQERIDQLGATNKELLIALEELMRVEKRDRIMPIGKCWDMAREAVTNAKQAGSQQCPG